MPSKTKGAEETLSALRFQIEKFNYGPRYADEYFEQLNTAANQFLARLYLDLFAQIERQVEGRRLIIIPHGALHYVPFHALVNRRGYLVDQCEISYAPSATVLKLCRARSRPSKVPNRRSDFSSRDPRISNRRSAISNLQSEISNRRSGVSNLQSEISNRDFEAPALKSEISARVSRLTEPHAERSAHRGARSPQPRQGKLLALGLAQSDVPGIADEIESLAELFPGAVTLTGSEATRDNLLREAPDARFLHLASHGYFRRDNPMFSFLKLADSQLNFYSLLDLKLSAELVTLSACHTGVNKVFPGDELHGLMRGFLHAGAPSLVASLWATSDQSTAELMKEMYSRIRAGTTKRAALREAQLAVKDDYGHPYYWAPFILMGNPN